MPKYSTAFGMDVHLRSTTVCALDADTLDSHFHCNSLRTQRNALR